MGYDPRTVFKLSEAFGGGMGTQSTCGAVSAMAMVIGMKESDGDMDAPATKGRCYQLMKQATQIDVYKRQTRSSNFYTLSLL